MDIVERLMLPIIPEYARLASDAKIEIERLREAAKDRPKDRPNEAADEIERLRDEIEDMHRRERSTAVQQLGNEGQWNDLVAAKDLEIERLREALESFSCECETEDDCCAVVGSFCGWEARAALKEGE